MNIMDCCKRRFIMSPAVWLTVLTWISAGGITSGYNVLVMMPIPSESHVFAFRPIAEELAIRGHNVTFASSTKQSADKSRPGLKYVHLQLADDVFQRCAINFFDGDFSNATARWKLIAMFQELAVETYKEPFIQDIIRSPRDARTGQPKHDVLILDVVFSEYALPLAYHMGVPSIFFSPAGLMPHNASVLDTPFQLSYLPLTMNYVTPPSLNFVDRLGNLFEAVTFSFIRWWTLYPYFNAVVARHLPDSPPISVLESNVSFVLQNMMIPLVRSSPLMPYYVVVGCVHCRPARRLPTDLEDFIQSSGDAGVIYFSLGSHTMGESMPLNMRDKVLEVFAHLPQKILWKYEKDIENLPKNIKLLKWAPQQDILGHSKLRLFITHGGSMSTQESGYHGCPLLAFPLGFDQIGNAGNAVMAGMAEYLDWKTFTERDLFDKITLLITDKRYKENAMKVSFIVRDNLVDPKVMAAHWIEYVVRHRGAHHLKSQAGNLNLFQYFLLDVIGFALLCLLLCLVAMNYSIKWLYGLFRKPSKASAGYKEKMR